MCNDEERENEVQDSTLNEIEGLQIYVTAGQPVDKSRSEPCIKKASSQLPAVDKLTSAMICKDEDQRFSSV